MNDKSGRKLKDLRISVTDRCNFRCTYCMPKEIYNSNYKFLKRTEILSFEEIIKLSNIFSSMGVKKIRLTGGEPLLRKNIHVLINYLKDIKKDLININSFKKNEKDDYLDDLFEITVKASEKNIDLENEFRKYLNKKQLDIINEL
mgnify:CR=1 FL=1